jgi:signal transduction histidine kinase
VEVDYTSMAWRTLGREVVLHRLVSHEGTSVVQGVILDRDYLLGEWIPALVDRHAVAGAEPMVIEGRSPAACALRRPASSILDGVELCYSPEAVAAVSHRLRDNLHLQLSALAGLVLIVTLAGVTINRAARRAEELSTQKSSFVSAVSHELRTPLTTIRMHAEMLRDGLVPEGKRDRFHGQLVHEAVRLSRLVENVLELSRLEEGRRVIELRSGDLTALVARLVAEQQHLAASRGFTLRGPSAEEPIEISYDEQAISQIVVNLVDNALKYAADAEPPVIDLLVERRHHEVVLRVLDHGPGIPPSERERVFQRFHRVASERVEHVPGTGIGLALVRELARAHGGDAEVLARAEGGCEVRVTLPS